MKSYKKSSHTVHDLKVHLVWVTKYRYKALIKDIGTRIRDIIREVRDKYNIQIIKGRVSRNHVHLYISYPSKLSVSDIIRYIKGRSSKKIQTEFPQLGKLYWGKHFWAIGYAAFSSGRVSDEMIQNYLDNHDKHPNYNDENFVIE